jgi:predicted MFS family arabinose efflux permease
MNTKAARASTGWKSPIALLIIMAATMHLTFAVWRALLNNFAVEAVNFSGADMGILQSIREIPGFLAFTIVFALLLFKEQFFGLLALILLGVGTALTGFFPTFTGFWITTLLMSTGFHYYETVHQSLSLQWLEKDKAAQSMGMIIGIGSFAAILGYGMVYMLWELAGVGFETIYLIGGGLAVIVAIILLIVFPQFTSKVEQRRKLVFRKRYWLYYALTFMSGARRQIFFVFAGFLMVEKFGLSVAAMSLLFLANMVLNMFLAPMIGWLIGRWGERHALGVEYFGLVIIFTAYAYVENAWIAMALYIIDHVFFAMAIAMKTYFQKIADPADIAPTAGVAFSINHIAAIFIPVVFGLIWLWSPALVFLCGAGMAILSFILAMFVPRAPAPGREFIWQRGEIRHPAE